AVSEPVSAPTGYYVLKVLERVPPDLTQLAPEREKLSAELLASKQTQAWEAWTTQARTAAKVETSNVGQPVRRARGEVGRRRRGGASAGEWAAGRQRPAALTTTRRGREA